MEKAVAIAIAIAVLVTLASVGFSSGRVYTVGDEAGWTVGVNYTAWASDKSFVVGDVLRFVYKATIDSVLVVAPYDYGPCNTGTPDISFHSGNDSLTLPWRGEHYFIGGSPGHCARGQKLHVHARQI